MNTIPIPWLGLILSGARVHSPEDQVQHRLPAEFLSQRILDWQRQSNLYTRPYFLHQDFARDALELAEAQMPDPRDAASYTLFERTFVVPDFVIGLMKNLTTPEIAKLTNVSRIVRSCIILIAGKTGHFEEIVMVRNEKWLKLVPGFKYRIIEHMLRTQNPEFHPASQWYNRYVTHAMYYRDIDLMERDLQWKEHIEWMLTHISNVDFGDVEHLRMQLENTQIGIESLRQKLVNMTVEDIEQRYEIKLPNLRFDKGDSKGAYMGVKHVYGNESELRPCPAWAFYSKLTGKDLYYLIRRLPVGRTIRKLVIDGTGVEDVELLPILRSVEITLEVVHARRCKKLTTNIWLDWLEDALFRNRPLALRELKMFGSSGADGPYCGSFPRIPPDILATAESPYYTRMSRFVQLIPQEWMFNVVLPMLLPQHMPFHIKYRAYVGLHMQIRMDYVDWDLVLKDYMKHMELGPFSGGNILADIPPNIRLMTYAKWVGFNLDLNHCAGGRYCWVYSTPLYQNARRNLNDHPIIEEDLNLGIPHADMMALMRLWNVQFPYVPCGRGERRESGGRKCANCGIWETENAIPPEQDSEEAEMLVPDPFMQHIGPGIWNTEVVKTLSSNAAGNDWNYDRIGQGRARGTGEYCKDCVLNQTCLECGMFFCANCLYPGQDDDVLPNPYCKKDAGSQMLLTICEVHRPMCIECARKNYMNCQVCLKEMCMLCHPGGLAVERHPVDFQKLYQEYLQNPDLAYTDPVCNIPKNVLPEPSKLPSWEAIRTDAALRGMHESFVYQYCSQCNTAVCKPCLGPNARKYPDCSHCGATLCDSCIQHQCDLCERTLCADCTEHEMDYAVTLESALAVDGQDDVPHGQMAMSLCVRCLVQRQYRRFEQYGIVPPLNCYKEKEGADVPKEIQSKKSVLEVAKNGMASLNSVSVDKSASPSTDKKRRWVEIIDEAIKQLEKREKEWNKVLRTEKGSKDDDGDSDEDMDDNTDMSDVSMEDV